MVNEIKYTNIRRILDEVLDHPMLRDVTLEQVVRHTVRFMELHGYPKLYQDKLENVEIHDYRGVLPCDLVSIVQVKDLKTGLCLRSMSGSFEGVEGFEKWEDKDYRGNSNYSDYRNYRLLVEGSFKTQGRVIYTSFPEGEVLIAYKAVPVDDDGFPMLIDNEVFLAALEAYIKKKVFTVKFDTGKIPAAVLQNAQQEYALLARQLMNEFTMPSISEMQSITNMWNTLIPKVREFDKGFRHLGEREYIKKH